MLLHHGLEIFLAFISWFIILCNLAYSLPMIYRLSLNYIFSAPKVMVLNSTKLLLLAARNKCSSVGKMFQITQNLFFSIFFCEILYSASSNFVKRNHLLLSNKLYSVFKQASNTILIKLLCWSPTL